jgi:GDPmannose 4,6-dehydratase
VTRKISVSVAKIMAGLDEMLLLGNLDAKRDWGYAPEFVEGMWRILQADKPDDYVLATNETHTVREFVEESFNYFNEEIVWEGKGKDETGRLKSSNKVVVGINPRYYRPTEVELLIGDYSKVKQDLGWEPKIKFKDLAHLMVKADYDKVIKRKE